MGKSLVSCFFETQCTTTAAAAAAVVVVVDGGAPSRHNDN